jgi:hypothetical protein
MRFIHPLIPLVCCGLMIGCAQHASPPSSGESDALVLDNHGGYSHAGRRVALRPDGSYTDTRYTDVIGDEKVQRGITASTQRRPAWSCHPSGEKRSTFTASIMAVVSIGFTSRISVALAIPVTRGSDRSL